MKAVIVILALAALSACSTVSGIGKDIQTSAEWTKEKMK